MKPSLTYEFFESESSPLPKGFLANLPKFFSKEGSTIYKGRNEIKIFQVGGQTVCVKKYHIPPFFNRILYSLNWRTPKARATYENAQKILARGFHTPVQYGYVLVREGKKLGESFSVGEYIADKKTMRELQNNAQAVRAFAKFTADLHNCGMMHRDYMLTNVMVSKIGNDYQFSLIDVNRFVFRDKPIRGFLQSLNLMHPFSSYQKLKFFLQAYKEHTPVSPFMHARVVRFRWWRNRYSDLKRILRMLPGAHLFTPHK